MFCTFNLSEDRIQLLKVILGLGFTLRHWGIVSLLTQKRFENVLKTL